MAWDIVGRRFSADEFDAYVDGLKMAAWKPEFAVLHNTSSPTIAQRPRGFTAQHMQNLYGYYAGQGWSGAPHLFVDQNGIWVFNPLTRKGVHAPSWNKVAWGVEMLGEFQNEPFDTGPGKDVRDHSMRALAALCKKGGFAPTTIRFHKEDPKTTHTSCPGKHVSKQWVITTVTQLMTAAPEPEAKLVIYRRGHGDEPAAVITVELRAGTAYAPAAEMAAATGLPVGAQAMPAVRDFLGKAYTLKWNAAARRVYAVEKA